MWSQRMFSKARSLSKPEVYEDAINEGDSNNKVIEELLIIWSEKLSDETVKANNIRYEKVISEYKSTKEETELKITNFAT